MLFVLIAARLIPDTTSVKAAIVPARIVAVVSLGDRIAVNSLCDRKRVNPGTDLRDPRSPLTLVPFVVGWPRRLH